MLQYWLSNAAALEEIWKTGSSFNAAALKTQCRSIGKKAEIREIGRIANVAALVPEAEKKIKSLVLLGFFCNS